MGRRPNPQRKIDLLDEILDYVTENGLSDLSLRPLANALGTSTYTLTYQFGSKEEMILDLVAHAESKYLARMEQLDTGASVQSFLDTVFADSTNENGMQWNRLLLEVVTMMVRDQETYSQFEGAVVRDRIERISALMAASGASEDEARRSATILSATLQGLVVDLMMTGDHDRVRDALDNLRALYEPFFENAVSIPS